MNVRRAVVALAFAPVALVACSGAGTPAEPAPVDSTEVVETTSGGESADAVEFEVESHMTGEVLMILVVR